MAKKRRRQTVSGLDGQFHSLVSKVEAWKQQRSELADDLRALIRSAEALLKDMGEAGRASVPSPARTARPRTRRRFSKAARAKMAAAMKRRWAEAKKAGKKKL